MPGSDKQIKTDVSRAVYWKNLKIETSDYNFNYKLDDKGSLSFSLSSPSRTVLLLVSEIK
jgi:hypothetical protein